VADPALELAYGVDPPAVVHVTVDPAHPVTNAIAFDVVNTSAGSIELVNPQELTPSDPLPAYGDAAPSPLSRIYVWFPWGDGAGDLATSTDAESIVASSGQPEWTVSNRMSDPTLGYYWILFPSSKSVFLERGGSVEVSFAGIVSRLPAGVTSKATWVKAEARVAGYAPAVGAVEIYKHVLSAKLTAPGAAAPGEPVELEWETVGVDSCAITPGGLPPGLAANGSAPVTMPTQERVVYTLTAQPHDGTSAIYASATVTAETGWIDLGPVPNPSTAGYLMPALLPLGDGLLLIQPGGDCWTSPDGRSWERVADAPSGDDRWGAGGVVTMVGRAWLFTHDDDTGAESLHSSPDGAAWTTVSSALPWGGGVDGTVPGAVDGTLWALSVPMEGPARLWSSPDGVDWTESAGAVPFAASYCYVLLGFAGALWVFGAGAGRDVWSTTDGATWTPHGRGPQNGQVTAATATSSQAWLAVQGSDSLLQTGTDMRWSALPLPPDLARTDATTLALAALHGHVVAAAADGHAWKYVPPLNRS
jgi:hypothetical protein